MGATHELGCAEMRPGSSVRATAARVVEALLCCTALLGGLTLAPGANAPLAQTPNDARRAEGPPVVPLEEVSGVGAEVSPETSAAPWEEAAARGDGAAVIEALPRPSTAEERVALLRALAQVGRYEDALEIGEAGLDEPAVRVAYGSLLVRMDRYDDAAAALDPLIEGRDTPVLAAQFWRAAAYDARGRRSRAALEYEDVLRAYQRGRAQSADDLHWVGRACHALGRVQDANDVYRQALERAPDHVDVRESWARLFLEKYRPDEAVALLDEAIERHASDPTLLTLRASAAFSLAYDRASATALVEKALSTNPSHPEALEMRALLALDDRRFEDAAADLDRVLDAFPLRREALTLRAASAWLRDDLDTFAALERQVLATDRRYARFYWSVGELAVRHFRYVEGVELFEQALELDAGFAPALVSLGIGYSRLGDDARAMRFLQRAFDADPFNVEAYNMANLWEQTLTEYRFVDDPEVEGLRYRFHREEASVLERYVPDAMREAWRTYEGRYGFAPEPPVSIEVFRDQATFSIRSVGLPHAGQHGICFGHVVTSRSPSEGNFNWNQVMAHELSHVFSLQRSNYRVPRWFTEGLAEYDTMLSRPEWYREQDLALVRALQRERLLGVMELDRAFTDVERFEQVLEAYYQASLVVEFIGTEWGYDALISMLDVYASGRDTPDAMVEVLGVEVRAFDARFEAHLRERYAGMLTLVEPAIWMAPPLATATAAAEARPASADAHADLAMALAQAGQLDAALAALEVALALDPRHPSALLLRGIASAEQGEVAAAEADFGALFDAGYESVTGRLHAGAIASNRGADDVALVHFRRALEAYPRSAEAARAVWDTEVRMGLDARGALATLVRLDQHDADAARELALERLAAGDVAGAFRAARQASDVNPFDARVRAAFGRAAFAQGAWEVAARELEGALEAGGGERESLLTMLATVYSELGRADDVARIRRLLSE